MEMTARMSENALVSRNAAAGSMVLLRNVRNTLPLTAPDSEKLPVAVFGLGQLRTAFAGTGMDPWRTVCVLDGLAASGRVLPDGPLAHKYRAWALSNPGAAAELPLDGELMQELAGRAAAAVAVVTRGADSTDLALRDDEKALLRAVSGAFARSVLVLNTPGYLDIAEFVPLFGAVVFMGIAGQEGGAALADVLTAKQVPSGRLADTWPLHASDWEKANRQTDLFTGYRYFDSFNKEVLFPFGFGLGYGKSVLGAFSVGLEGRTVSVEATIENAGGAWPLREVLQVYFSGPDGGAVKPVYCLDCFAKTGPLAPGERETVHLSFPVSEMCVYDETSSSFRLEAGYYDIRVGTDSRNTTIAGSVYVSRELCCLQLRPCTGRPNAAVRSRRGTEPFSYPGEAEEKAAAHRHAMRLSGRGMTTRTVKYSKKFPGCRGGREGITLRDVMGGSYTAEQLAASMDEHALRALVCGFGSCEPAVPGAYGASPDLRVPYGIPPVTIAYGSCGIHVDKDVPKGGGTTAHQYVTAFPAPSLLACSFDRELLERVGAAIGREARELGVDLWLAPSATIHRRAGQYGFYAAFSEDPVLSGVCAGAVISGCQRHAMAALRHVMGGEAEVALTERTLREVDLLGFEIAVRAGKPSAVLVPLMAINGEACGLDMRLFSDVLHDEWGFDGAVFAAGELFSRFPGRPLLESAALPTLRLILKSGAFARENP